MLLEQQPAYVLHTRAYRETSLLLECLTRDHGRLGVVARGVRSQRSRVARSQLEPFQLLSMDMVLRGEMATLREVESVAIPRPLSGDKLLAGLYINELVVRLSAREDPHPQLYAAYARTLQRLVDDESLAWTLRRFERDLLAALGYGMQLQYESDTGEPLEADIEYSYLPEQGPVTAAQPNAWRINGASLLALAADQMPETGDLRALRRLLRSLISHHLGGAELRSWHVLSGGLSHRSPVAD